MKVRYLLVILSLLFTGISCEKAITLKPENSTTFLNGMDSEQELYSGLTTIVYFARSYATWNRNYPDARGYLADKVNSYWKTVQELDDNTAIDEGLQDSYKIIQESFIVLQALDNVDLSEDLYNQYLGSVKFFQAWAYLEIMKNFGDCIILKKDTDLGYIAKSSMPEVAAYAIQLAEEAVELLPEYSDYIGDNSLGKAAASKGAANALLAELCLWQAGCKWFAKDEDKDLIDQGTLWEIAEQACTDIINSGEYSLAASAEEVVTNVLDLGSPEGIYVLPWKGFDDEDSDFRIYNIYEGGTSTWPVRKDKQPSNIVRTAMQISSNLAKSMYEEGDQRRTSYFYKLDDPEPEMDTSYAYPYKYRETRYTALAGNEYGRFKHIDQEKVWYRLTQVYMMRAEARAQLNKNTLAIDDLNTIRRRSTASDYNSAEDGGDLLMAIYKECDKEFVYEDERYFRTIRFGERFVRQFFKGKFKTITIQDFIDGAFFNMYQENAFEGNPLFRQNIYWSKKQI